MGTFSVQKAAFETVLDQLADDHKDLGPDDIKQLVSTAGHQLIHRRQTSSEDALSLTEFLVPK